MFPAAGWKSIVEGHLEAASITESHILAYFVHYSTSTGDGPAMNFKAVASTDQKSRRLFECGYVQKIELCRRNDNVFYKARCAPEMRSRADYKLRLCVSVTDTADVKDVCYADCSCPAGKGPKGSCKHLAALFYALENFTKCGFAQDVQTCTDVLQTWNQPSKKKSEPMELKSMDWQRQPVKDGSRKSKRKHTAADLLDPRAVSKRNRIQDEVDEYAYQSLHAGGAALGLTLVSGSGALKEINYEARWQRQNEKQAAWRELREDVALCLEAGMSDADTDIDSTPMPSDSECMDNNDRCWSWYETNVCVSEARAVEIQQCTLDQHGSDMWRKERCMRITASIAKCVARRKDSTPPDNLVKRIIDRKSFSTAATAWGVEHEDVARTAYIEKMRESPTSISVSQCGLVISCKEPWLGASPDGIIRDGDVKGVLEIKCPFSARNMTLSEAAASIKNFCVQQNGSALTLRRNHAYYYQVNVQLFVTGLSFADFVVWLPGGDVFIERIPRDDLFIFSMLPKLKSFYFAHVLPKLAGC